MEVALGILVVGVLFGVGYLIKRTISTSIALGQVDEARKQTAEHVEKLERAAADERARELEVYDAKAVVVSDAAGAAELLRGALRPRK